MKRTCKLWAILLCLCMICTACGIKGDMEETSTEAPPVETEVTTDAPKAEVPAAEVAATEETATEMVVIEPGNIHRVVIATDELVQPIEMGKTMLADLDGDGVPEKITVRSESSDDSHSQEELHFQVNDLYYHEGDFGKLVPWGSLNVPGSAFYLVDLDTSDRYKEILINGSSFDGRAYFLRYHQGELIPIGGYDIPSVILSGEDISICGDGTVKASEFDGLFETKRVTKTWKLIDQDCFHTALAEVTEFYEYSLRPADNKLTLSQEMTFFAQMDGNLDDLLTLPAGTKIDVARYYPDTGWIQFLYDGDTKEAWMRLIGGRVLLPMNIYKSDIDNYISGFSKAG